MPRYFVLRSNPEDLDFFDEFQFALSRVLDASGLDFDLFHTEQPDEDTVKYIYMESKKRGAVNIYDDLEIPARYMEIEGESEEFENSVADAFLPQVPTVSTADLAAEARREPSSTSLRRLALGAGPGQDPKVLAIVTGFLKSESDDEVAAAAEAAGILQWPDLVPELEAAARAKHKAVTSRLVEAALAACRAAAK
jgi:hypothetical protein